MKTISDWKKKRTKSVSDKILIICEVLDVTPYDLLSGAANKEGRSRECNTYIIDKETNLGMLIESYQELDYGQQRRLMGYMDALIRDNNNGRIV